MNRLYRTLTVAPCLALISAPLLAQSISIGLRGSGSFPTGSFAEQQVAPGSSDVLIAGAKSGFGYGVDVGVGLGPIGVYAGFDHINFDCQTETCRSDGKYTLQGVTAGVKLAMPMITASVFKTEVSVTEISMVYPQQGTVDLTTTGYVVPQSIAKIGAKVVGRITKSTVKEWQEVKQDQVLFVLDATDQKAAIAID